ncbi:MAG: DUF2812 domain-containing protein [Eubacteriales bacterium]|nr:DUF2812 domain-containing protein [Eubacteriales bacterium]
MKKIIHKLFMAWDFEEEEKWINEMAAKGLELTDMSLGRYVFEEGEQGAYQYRVELLEYLPNHPQSEQYIRFMEETGIEHVASMNRWVYFRKKADEGSFELYSDTDSKITHLKRINVILFVALVGQLWCSILNLCFGISNKFWFNVGAGCFTLVLGIFILVGMIRIMKKIGKLKKQRDIYG